MISRAASEACKQAVADKLEGARELSEKEAVEAVCQVFTNSLEYEPTTPVASACAGSSALQGAWPACACTSCLHQSHCTGRENLC